MNQRVMIILLIFMCLMIIPVTADDPKIVFTSTNDFEIYIMDADGSDQTQLTDNAAIDTQPSLALDVMKIAFSSSRDGNWEIYIMDADGSDQTRLTNVFSDDTDPSFSPDGTKIVFSSWRDGNPEIYVMNANDGSDQARLTNNDCREYYPSFSPDGTKIVFESDRGGNFEVYIMDADGSDQTQLTDNRGKFPRFGVLSFPDNVCIDDLAAISGCGSIELSWTGINADQYNIYRGTTSGGPYALIGTTLAPGYLDLSVVVGTPYFYVVRPFASGNEYCESNEASATPDDCTPVPEFPMMVLPLGFIAGLAALVFVIRKQL